MTILNLNFNVHQMYHKSLIDKLRNEFCNFKFTIIRWEYSTCLFLDLQSKIIVDKTFFKTYIVIDIYVSYKEYIRNIVQNQYQNIVKVKKWKIDSSVIFHQIKESDSNWLTIGRV